jgi:UPF0716 family protein affecting phage T7 exclusion
MPLILIIAGVLVCEWAAPGFIASVLGPLVGAPLSLPFLAGFVGMSLSAGFWMSLGRTGLASEQHGRAIEKAEAEYRRDKGII